MVSINDLPGEVLAEIFSRLPVKFVLACCCVCKTWLRLTLNNSHFARLHFSRTPSSVILQFRDYDVCEGVLYLEDPEADAASGFDEKKTMNPFFRIPQCGINEADPEENRLVIKNSCNGLLYLEEDLAGVSIVCNPITNEFIVVPEYVHENSNRKHSRASSWLGFCPQTKQFKILMILHFVGRIIECKVYDLKSNSWRSIEDDSGYSSALYWHFRCSFLNGSIHWIPHFLELPEFILSFDFGKEKFGEVPPPLDFGQSHREAKSIMSTGILRGCLFITDETSFFGFLAIWIMKDYGVQESWSIDFKIITGILRDIPYDRVFLQPFQPLQELSNGKILLMKPNMKLYGKPQTALVCYDPNSGKNRIEKNRCFGKDFDAIVHTPSFVSLEDFVSSDRLKMHSNLRVPQLGDELPGQSEVPKDQEWLVAASKLVEQISSKGGEKNNLDLSKWLGMSQSIPNLAALESALVNASPADQRILLGKSLRPLVEALEPKMADKVTGMILELDQTKILHFLKSPEALKAIVAKAKSVLQ